MDQSTTEHPFNVSTTPHDHLIVSSTPFFNSSHAVTYDPSVYEDYLYYLRLRETEKDIWLKGAPTLLTVGILGNILSIMVLCRSNLRQSNTAIYLIVLSVSDILVLCTGLLRQYMKTINEGEPNADIRRTSSGVCKVHLWLTYSTLDMSQWVIVALTVERVISVLWPHRVRRYCTPCSSLISLGTICVLLLIINSHFLFGFGIVEQTITSSDNTTMLIGRECAPMWTTYSLWQKNVWPWVDLCLYSLVPLSLIIVFNISIVVKVIYSRRPVRSLDPTRSSSLNVHVQSVDVRSKQVSSMTTILVVLTFMCLVTTMPVSAFFIVRSQTDNQKRSFREVADFSLAYAVVNILAYTSNSVNFVLYCMSGSRFRKELLSMCRRPIRVAPLPHRRTTTGTTQMTTAADTESAAARGQSRSVSRPSLQPVQAYRQQQQEHREQQQRQDESGQERQNGQQDLSRQTMSVSSTLIEDDEFILRLQNPQLHRIPQVKLAQYGDDITHAESET